MEVICPKYKICRIQTEERFNKCTHKVAHQRNYQCDYICAGDTCFCNDKFLRKQKLEKIENSQ